MNADFPLLMKISVSWLKDFLPSFSSDIPALVEKLTFLGFEVEEIRERTLPDELVVVGRIEEVMLHPNAERLTICRVNVGRDELLQIAYDQAVAEIMHDVADYIQIGEPVNFTFRLMAVAPVEILL